VYDITEFMEKDNYKDQFLDAAIKQAAYDGSIWAVPVENVTPAFFFYNKRVFEENSLEVPSTLEEFEAVSDKLLEKGIIPVALANRTKWTGSIFYAYVLNRIAGANAFADAYDGKRSFTDDDFLKAAQKIQEWSEKGYFGNDFNALDYDAGQDRQLLYNDKAAMYVMGSWFIFTAMGENPDFVDHIGIAEFPVAEDGKGRATDYIGTVGDNFYSVSANSKNPEMAFEAITYLLDDIAVEERIASGKIPPLKGVTLTDDINKLIADRVASATHMQLWLDQYLAPQQAELHKDELQKLYSGANSPAEYNEAMQEGIHGE
jgi:raffinose/stachyose/melibiose transport system substrate-binding protein